MNIYKTYNTKKQNTLKIITKKKKINKNSKSFKSNHNYFNNEFPTFKINIP